MCIGGDESGWHYRCAYSSHRGDNSSEQYRDSEWRDGEATEMFWRE
jgi:hypothetical protein